MNRLFSVHLVALLILLLSGMVIGFSLAASPASAAVYKEHIDPHWSEDNSHFWYRNDLAGGQREYVLVDVVAGQRRTAFDHARLANALADAGIENVEAERLAVEALKFNLTGKTVEFRTGGREFQCHLESYELTPTEQPRIEPEQNSAEHKKDAASNSESEKPRPYHPSRDVSPDGKWRAFVQGRRRNSIERRWRAEQQLPGTHVGIQFEQHGCVPCTTGRAQGGLPD